MSLTILTNLAFCTFSTSRIMVREVLEDWFTFLGGQPKQVIFAVWEHPGFALLSIKRILIR